MVTFCLDSPQRLMQKQCWRVIFGLYMKKGLTINMVPFAMERDDKTSKVLCGMNYHKYSLYEDDCANDLSCEEIKKSVLDYCILLPYKDKKDKEFECLYGVVFKDWDVIDSLGNKTLPILSSKEFAVGVTSTL